MYMYTNTGHSIQENGYKRLRDRVVHKLPLTNILSSPPQAESTLKSNCHTTHTLGTHTSTSNVNKHQTDHSIHNNIKYSSIVVYAMPMTNNSVQYRKKMNYTTMSIISKVMNTISRTINLLGMIFHL